MKLRYKIGTPVKIKSTGDIGVVVDYDKQSNAPYTVRILRDGNQISFSKDEIMGVT